LTPDPSPYSEAVPIGIPAQLGSGFKAAHQETGAKHFGCLEILMSYQDKSYHLPSPEVKRFLLGTEVLPGELLMYIYLTKPQNTRKQNGITGFSSHDPESAWAKLTCS